MRAVNFSPTRARQVALPVSTQPFRSVKSSARAGASKPHARPIASINHRTITIPHRRRSAGTPGRLSGPSRPNNLRQVYGELRYLSRVNQRSAILIARPKGLGWEAGMRCLLQRLAVASLVVLPLHAQDFQEANVQRWGADYARTPMAGKLPADCAEACGVDTRCHAWTFVKSGVEGKEATCHLKSAVPHGASDPCCVSGVAGGAALTALNTPPAAKAVSASTPKSAAAPIVTVTKQAAEPALAPTGLTGSIRGGAAAMSNSAAPQMPPMNPPMLTPLSPPITARATAPPMSVRPPSWGAAP
jgi:hypothetical protein